MSGGLDAEAAKHGVGSPASHEADVVVVFTSHEQSGSAARPEGACGDEGSFDDQASFLLQVLTGVEIDDGENPATLSNEELEKRAKRREALRMQNPGCTNINFEMSCNIVLEVVIGWDKKNDKPMGRGGLFGLPYAFADTIEEQSRKTLHSHMSVWIEGFNAVQQDLFFGNGKQKKTARRTCEQCIDATTTTQFFPVEGNFFTIKTALDHDCKQVDTRTRKRGKPNVVSDQELRILRHRFGYDHNDGGVMSCPDCDKTWTHEDMVASLPVHEGTKKKDPQEDMHCRTVKSDPHPPLMAFHVEQERHNFKTKKQTKKSLRQKVPMHLLHSKMVEWQKTGNVNNAPVATIDAAHQHHLSCHVQNSCFKCQKAGSEKRGHVCGPECECRLRLPARKRARTEVHCREQNIPWCAWNGEETEHPLVELSPKRGEHDAFQNQSCAAVSESKFSCNANVQCVTPGPLAMHASKHCTKPNQEEERSDHAGVEASMRKIEGRTHENDRTEAVRTLLRAAFAHDKATTVNAPFASCLIRKKSRFYFSHEFACCPLKDLTHFHDGLEVCSTCRMDSDGRSHFESPPLNYLCRNSELEDLTFKEMIEKFKSACAPTKKTNDDRNEVLPFIANAGACKHPSVAKAGPRKGECCKGLEERDKEMGISVSQWTFPDTATFEGNTLTADECDRNSKMEWHAQLVLTSLVPHRSKEDLLSHASGTKCPCVQKLQEVHKHEEKLKRKKRKTELPRVLTEDNIEFLQNVQNCRANALRCKMEGDDLSRDTEPCEVPLSDVQKLAKEKTPEKIATACCEDFLEAMEEDDAVDPHDEDPAHLKVKLQGLSFEHVRKQGIDDCGCPSADETPSLVESLASTFLKCSPIPEKDDEMDEVPHSNRPVHKVEKIVELFMRRNQPKSIKKLWKERKNKHKTINVSPATGSTTSMREWGKAALGNDPKQVRAFEVIVSAFLLTFYDCDKSENDRSMETEQTARCFETRKALLHLKGNDRDHQLICLLHGPGGSGKSTVLNTVIAHAKDYCTQLGHEWTSNTIVTTAMSGVAATLLHGQTTHSALVLNSAKVSAKVIDKWKDARLLIIDEISFASKSDIAKMESNLRKLMSDESKKCGGLNVVFAGDCSQLVPVRKTATYDEKEICNECHGMLNCFIELDGKWRFTDGPVWGDRMARFRAGEPTTDDVQVINKACCGREPDKPMQHATHSNKDRDAINCAVFEECCKKNKPSAGAMAKGAVMIFMDDPQMQRSNETWTEVRSNAVKHFFYAKCGEDDCDMEKGRVDPVLKLCPGCPLMPTRNKDVLGGEANGTRVRCQQVHVKPGETPFVVELRNGMKVTALFASQVHSIDVEHENEDITPRQFKVASNTTTFLIELEFGDSANHRVKVKGTQFLLIGNSATTGHKSQGCTVKEIFVNDWHYKGDWAHVVLSRVRTMAGPYIRQPLSMNLRKHKMPERMKNMLEHFKEKAAVTFFSEDEYNLMEAAEAAS